MISKKNQLSRTARAGLLGIAAVIGLGALPAAGMLIDPAPAHAVVGRGGVDEHAHRRQRTEADDGRDAEQADAREPRELVRLADHDH